MMYDSLFPQQDEAPKTEVDNLWKTCCEKNPNDPLKEFIYLLSYCDFGRPGIWLTEFCEIATNKIKEYCVKDIK